MAAETGHLSSRVYVDQLGNLHLNGAKLFSAGEIDIAPYLETALRTQPAYATLTPAASTANVCLVTIQVKDGAGVNLAVPTLIDVWLSDAATGAGTTGTTTSGAVTIVTSGSVYQTVTTKVALRVLTDATGKAILSITDTAKSALYVVAAVPGNKPSVSNVLATGDYG